jgi:hypothetical protein
MRDRRIGFAPVVCPASPTTGAVPQKLPQNGCIKLFRLAKWGETGEISRFFKVFGRDSLVFSEYLRLITPYPRVRTDEITLKTSTGRM